MNHQDIFASFVADDRRTVSDLEAIRRQPKMNSSFAPTGTKSEGAIRRRVGGHGQDSAGTKRTKGLSKKSLQVGQQQHLSDTTEILPSTGGVTIITNTTTTSSTSTSRTSHSSSSITSPIAVSNRNVVINSSPTTAIAAAPTVTSTSVAAGIFEAASKVKLLAYEETRLGSYSMEFNSQEYEIDESLQQFQQLHHQSKLHQQKLQQLHQIEQSPSPPPPSPPVSSSPPSSSSKLRSDTPVRIDSHATPATSSSLSSSGIQNTTNAAMKMFHKKSSLDLLACESRDSQEEKRLAELRQKQLEQQEMEEKISLLEQTQKLTLQQQQQQQQQQIVSDSTVAPSTISLTLPNISNIINHSDNSSFYYPKTDKLTATGGNSSPNLIDQPTVKVLLVGDMGVGKTSLLKRYYENTFLPQLSSTEGVDFRTRVLYYQEEGNLRKKEYKFQLWDTAGSEQFHQITKSYYRSAHAFAIVYDIGNYSTVENLPFWIDMIRATVDPTVPILLIGNKADLIHERVVEADVVEAYALENGLFGYFEVSAFSGVNVEIVMDTLSQFALQRYFLFLHQQLQQTQSDGVALTTSTIGSTGEVELIAIGNVVHGGGSSGGSSSNNNSRAVAELNELVLDLEDSPQQSPTTMTAKVNYHHSHHHNATATTSATTNNSNSGKSKNTKSKSKSRSNLLEDGIQPDITTKELHNTSFNSLDSYLNHQSSTADTSAGSISAHGNNNTVPVAVAGTNNEGNSNNKVALEHKKESKSKQPIQQHHHHNQSQIASKLNPVPVSNDNTSNVTSNIPNTTQVLSNDSEIGTPNTTKSSVAERNRKPSVQRTNPKHSSPASGTSNMNNNNNTNNNNACCVVS